eukprot:6334716-Amphidinium_carterae.1
MPRKTIKQLMKNCNLINFGLDTVQAALNERKSLLRCVAASWQMQQEVFWRPEASASWSPVYNTNPQGTAIF